MLANPGRYGWTLTWLAILAIALPAHVQMSSAQSVAEFHRILTVAPAEPVRLKVEVTSGEVEILYGRDGQVSISGFAKATVDAHVDENFFSRVLTVAQEGNHLVIRHGTDPAYPEKGISVLYRIDVPYRTEVTSKVNQGKQNISGIMGPVKALTVKGDIKAAYISKGLQAQVDEGNLDIQVIGEHVEAKAGSGNISCTRLAQGVSAETGDGDITLMVVGPSTATVKKGNGRIDVGGARGSFTGSTDAGDLHIKALPHEDWRLSSGSGSVRLELPAVARLDLDASTQAGQLQIDRDDLAKPEPGAHQFRQELNGGGKRIEVRTGSGKIAIR
jgi:hypothetical protein